MAIPCRGKNKDRESINIFFCDFFKIVEKWLRLICNATHLQKLFLLIFTDLVCVLKQNMNIVNIYMV